MIIIAKTFDFSASHRLYRPEWSDEENRSVFGKCSNPTGHGHNYRLEVLVGGPVDSKTGFVVDAGKLALLIEALILKDVDHKNLNVDVVWLEGMVTSTENIVARIWDRLSQPIGQLGDGVVLQEVKLWETRKIFALRRRES